MIKNFSKNLKCLTVLLFLVTSTPLLAAEKPHVLIDHETITQGSELNVDYTIPNKRLVSCYIEGDSEKATMVITWHYKGSEFSKTLKNVIGTEHTLLLAPDDFEKASSQLIDKVGSIKFSNTSVKQEGSKEDLTLRVDCMYRKHM